MHASRICLLIPALCALLVSAAAAEVGNKPVTRTLQAHDGLKLVCNVGGRGDTALIFLHGWSGDRGWWSPQMEAFGSAYAVVAYDQAGHGESGKNRQTWNIEGFAQDVQAVIRSLGIKRAVLVGHSMSGMISLRAASLMPGVIVGVIGVDTLQNAESRPPEEQTRQFLEGLRTNFTGTVRFGIRGMLPENTDPNLVERISRGAEQQDPQVAMAIMQGLFTADQGKLFREARVPVRCINAAPGTTMFATPTAAEINSRYADYKVVIMDGVGHFPMLEKPDEFNRKLREVLAEFAPGR